MNKLYVTVEDGKVVTLGNAKGEIETKYAIPYDLDTLTIEQAQAAYKYIQENAPEEYIAFMTGEAVPEEEVWSSKLREYTTLVCGTIAAVSGVPAEAFAALSLPKQRAFADEFELQVIRPLYMIGLYEPKNRESFMFEGVEYFMPRTAPDGVGGQMPFADRETEEFCEAFDLALACKHPIELAPLIVAILCRPEGEKYNEMKARERAEKFKTLPTSIALDVFFYKVLRLSIMATLTQMYLGEIAKNRAAEMKSQAAQEAGSPESSTQHEPTTEA